MKPVLITQRVETVPEYGERRDALDQRWVGLLAKVGLVPVAVPNKIDSSGLRGLLSLPGLAGVILTGGASLVEYGGATPERDALERELIANALESRTPLLGVCRGLQVLLTYFGAALDVIEGHVAVRHGLSVCGKGAFADRLRPLRDVNSYHDLCARSLDAPLRVVAKADDGTIEAVEHSDAPLAGIMWHPERAETPSDPDLDMLAWFFGARPGEAA